MSSSRDSILHRVRTALGRSAGQAPETPPDLWLRTRVIDSDERVRMFCQALEKLGGKTLVAANPDEARSYVEQVIRGKRAVASNAPLLVDCGITILDGVERGFTDATDLRRACATAGAGITSADWALADTGTLVMLSSQREARLISLLPPAHIAVIPRNVILAGLDELFLMIPHPAALTSSMVLITGPSRTADIEQILVRGVHGPGEIHVVVV